MTDSAVPRWKKWVKPVVVPPVKWSLRQAARLQRRRLDGLCYVGITGSQGKTTAKNLLAAVLATRHRVQANPGSLNGVDGLARRLLLTTRRDAFFVYEVGASGPGSMIPAVKLLRPSVGIVTNVARDHYSSFRGEDGVAREKTRLIRALPPEGLAVLNADDPRVLAMRSATRARVVTYGRAAEADFRAEADEGAWPDPLRFRLRYANEAWQVRTRLYGRYWTTAVLAAVAAGVSLGVPVADALAAVATVEPEQGRLSPFEAGGIRFLDDSFKAPLDSLPALWEFLSEAQAPRRVVIVGTISDYPGSASRRYRQVARAALEAADLVVFVGARAKSVRAALAGPDDTRLQGFGRYEDASGFLAENLRPGDLVVVKTSRMNHAERLMLARTAPVSCWRERCGLDINCASCRLLDKPFPRGRGDAASR